MTRIEHTDLFDYPSPPPTMPPFAPPAPYEPVNELDTQTHIVQPIHPQLSTQKTYFKTRHGSALHTSVSVMPSSFSTADNSMYCLDGILACEENLEFMHKTSLIVDMDRPSFTRRRYLLAIRFLLTREENYKLFESQFADGGKSYKISLFDDYKVPMTNTPIRQIDQQAVQNINFEDTIFTHMIPFMSDSDAYYDQLSRARYVQIQLTGKYRQLVTRGVQLLERDFETYTDNRSIPLAQIQEENKILHQDVENITGVQIYMNSVPDVSNATKMIVHSSCGFSIIDCARASNESFFGSNLVKAFTLSNTMCCRSFLLKNFILRPANLGTYLSGVVSIIED